MIVHNLTDYSMPYRPPRSPRTLKVAGRVIEPGKSAEVPDHLLQPSDIAGWITANVASIDGLPEWYQAARRKVKDLKTKERVELAKATSVDSSEEPDNEV